jgi:hypothetical protein
MQKKWRQSRSEALALIDSTIVLPPRCSVG